MAGREKQGSSNEQAEAPGPNPFGIKDPTMARNGSLERPPASKEPLKALSALIFHIWGNQRHQQHSLEPIPSKFPCYEHMTSGITLPGEKVVPLWRTYPCPAEAAGTGGGGAGFTPAAMGRSALETTTPVAVSKFLALSAPGSGLSSWESR